MVHEICAQASLEERIRRLSYMGTRIAASISRS